MNLSNRKNSGTRSHHFTDFANAKSHMKTKRGGSGKSISDLGKGILKPKDKKGKGNTFFANPVVKRVGIIFSLTFLFGILFGVLFLLGLVSAYSKDLPNIDEYFKKSNNDNKETVIVDRNGKELYRIRGDELKERVSINDVPDKLQWAFLAAEDANFKTHKGLNIFGLSRALLCHAQKKTGCGGGSSITQQLIKNTTPLKQQTLERKVKEAILAMKVEQSYSKDQILEFYLNVVPEGGILNGVKTGSKYMFGEEDLNKLSLAQIAYLAAIPNEPPVLSPWGGSYYNPDKSQDRARYVLDRMLELKDRTGVTEEEIRLAKEELPNVKFRTTDLNKKAPHYVDYVIKELNNIYADKVEEGQEGYTYLKDKGYTIVTAVDLDTQIMLEDTLRNSIKNDPNFQKNVGSQNGAAVMMDPKTGEIIAMVGSRDFYEESNDPRFSPQANAALYDRSLGSTMKPILYMTAFMNGYNPSSIVPDLPLDLRPAGAGTPYNVNNYDRRTGTFGNFLTMRTALQRSLNIPAVSTGHYFDIKQYEETYKKLSGYDRFKVQGPAAPLGAANMPLLEQVHAYSTLASEGVYRPKKVILEIKDDQNKVILDNRTVESKQVVDKKYTYLINDMNKKYWLFSGFSYSDPLLVKMGQTMDVAGKTGTSDTSESGVGDVAFVAYTPNFVLGMWAGNSCGSTKCPISNNATGENLYKHMYKPFLEKYWTQIKPEKWYTGNNLPEGVRRVELCSLTGKLKSDACAAAGGTIISEFVADTSMPSQEDMIEQVSVTQCPDVEKLARQIDKDLGLATTKTYIRYDKLFKNKFISDQVAVYLTKNGRMPPTEECGVQRNVQGTSITIVSPPVGAVYAPNQDLTVTATVSGDIPIQKVELVDWNGNIVQTYTAAPFNVSYATKAPATPGTYKVTVVATDNNGETKKESSFTVSTSAPTPTVTVSTDQGVDFNGPKNVKLTAALNNYSGTIISGKFNITGTVPAQYGGAVSGNQMTATWMATVKDNYTVEAVFTTSTGVYKDSIKVRVR